METISTTCYLLKNVISGEYNLEGKQWKETMIINTTLATFWIYNLTFINIQQ